jgi:hypothetical protein
MPLPTDTGAIFDLLAADEVLAPILGEYRWPNGNTAPAIARLWASNPGIEPGVTVEGLEIIVHRQAPTQPQPWATGEIHCPTTFLISLVQHQPRADGTGAPWVGDELEVAKARVLTLLPGAVATDVGLPDGSTGLGQYSVRWVNPEIVLNPES